jgi:hypothetical protein
MIDSSILVERRRTVFQHGLIEFLLQELPGAEVGRGPAFVRTSRLQLNRTRSLATTHYGLWFEGEGRGEWSRKEEETKK